MSKDLSSNQIDPTQDMNNGLKSLVLIMGTIGWFFTAQVLGIFILITVFSLFGHNSTEIQDMISDNPAVQFGAIFLIEAITVGAIWWAHSYRKQNFLKLIGLGEKPKISSLGYAVITYGIYFLTLIVTVAVVSNFIPSINVDQAQDLGFESAVGSNLIFVFFTLVVLPPIAEEILFRGFLFKRLKGLISIYPAAIITSTIFALAHTEFLGDNPLNWIAAIDTFILSFFLIYLLQKTNSLWASIFLHGIKNSIAFVILFII